ncbi:MAG TPA: glycosyltransferase family 2 protein, partial [Halobacteriales archaeon]|nr:glycosyltransferase family 2 protein [Halobacteriales archaeon]
MAQAQSLEWIKRTIEAEADAATGGSQVVRPSVDEPAVGILANRGDSADVAAAILRARRAGYRVILTYEAANADRETLEFAEDLGVRVVEPETGLLDDLSPTTRLRQSAREQGYPGVILIEDLSVRVDLEASRRRLAESDAYLVEAQPAPAVSIPGEVLVGIPAYNEAGSIGDVVDRASEYGTVVVVDDGSDDSTAAEARAAGAVVVEHEGNRGYGAALKTLFTEAERAGASNLVVIDADGQHEPADIPRLVDAQKESGSQLVIGSRFAEGAETNAPIYRLVGLFVVNLLTNLSLGVVRKRSRVGDSQSGFRAYDRRAIESLAADESIGDRMSASTDILYHAHHHDFAIEEVGTSIYYDVEAASSQNPLSHGLDLVNNILKTVERDRPVLTLGVPGVVG